METVVIKEPELVVGLDIGSTYSGYAWQWRDEFIKKGNVEFNTTWGAGAQLPKTISCVLLETNIEQQKKYELEQGDINDRSIENIRQLANSYKLISFGHRAERDYETILRDEREENVLGKWFFFKRFKHLLCLDKFSATIDAEDHFAQHVPLLIVMSMLIKGLKEHFIRKCFGEVAIPEKTLWVVTVPAIWSDQAKMFMREAAEMTGIKRNKLMLAKEPEAAAVYCMILSQSRQNNMGTFGDPGQTFLVADLGGLTADLSALKILENGHIKEVIHATGKDVGGQNINDCFFQICQESFKGEAWHKIIRSSKPVEMLEMEKDFELKKMDIGSNDPRDEYIELKIPETIKDKLRRKAITLKKNAEKQHCFIYKDMKFWFKSQYVNEVLFNQTCKMTYQVIKKQLVGMENCDFLVLVGGFAQSPIVKKHIKDQIAGEFPSVQVQSPTSPFHAVLIGCVLFGHDPMIFDSRISGWTFGVSTHVPFNAKIHDVVKKWKNGETGEYYCSQVFDIHVRKDQSVELDAPQRNCKYKTMFKDQTSMNIGIYKSNNPNPKYTTDDGCEFIGYIRIMFPATASPREISVSMNYGGTEIAVVATDCETKQECKAEISFENLPANRNQSTTSLDVTNIHGNEAKSRCKLM